MVKPPNESINLLVVDDEKSICDILSQYLSKSGYRTWVAQSGEQALDILHRQGIDLILTDIKMPGISGVDLLKKVKEEHINIPVLLTTGFPTLDTAVEALKLGAYDYLTKPFHLEEIGEKIRRALTNRRLEEENALFSSLVSLHEVTRVLISTHDLSDLQRQILDYCCKHTQATAGALMFADGKAGMQLSEEWGENIPAGFWLDQLFQTAVAKAVSQGKPLTFPAGEHDELLEGSAVWPDLESCIVFPLKTFKRVLGAICLVRKKGAGTFSYLDIEMVNVLASQSSISIENVRLYQNIRDNYLRTIKGFALAVEAKDPYTHGHSENVMKYSVVLAKRLGLRESDIDKVKYAGLLHDIGKIGVSEAILNKPGRLSPDEFEEIKKHPELGMRIVKDVPFLQSLSPFILHHHEFYNGNGYPDRLKGDEIPLGARILGVCDAYEAMTSDRPYRKAMTMERATGILKENIGAQFDPDITSTFVNILESARSASPDDTAAGLVV